MLIRMQILLSHFYCTFNRGRIAEPCVQAAKATKRPVYSPYRAITANYRHFLLCLIYKTKVNWNWILLCHLKWKFYELLFFHCKNFSGSYKLYIYGVVKTAFLSVMFVQLFRCSMLLNNKPKRLMTMWDHAAAVTGRNGVGCRGGVTGYRVFRRNCVFFQNSLQPLPRCKRPSKLSTQCDCTVTPIGW